MTGYSRYRVTSARRNGIGLQVFRFLLTEALTTRFSEDPNHLLT